MVMARQPLRRGMCRYGGSASSGPRRGGDGALGPAQRGGVAMTWVVHSGRGG
jgi:hypothetical protein